MLGDNPKVDYEDEILGPAPSSLGLNVINVVNFLKLYGAQVSKLELTWLEGDMLGPLALTINGRCPNLKSLTFDVDPTKCLVDGEPRYPPLPNISRSLTSAHFMSHYKRRIMSCSALLKMAQMWAQKAPNLECLRVDNSSFLDLGECTRLKSLHCCVDPDAPYFSIQELKRSIGSAPWIEKLKIEMGNSLVDPLSTYCPGITALRQLDHQRPLPTMPNLQELMASFTRRIPIGPFLSQYIFSGCMPALKSLTVVSTDYEAIGNWLRDFHGVRHNGVRKLEIVGVRSRITNQEQLAQLQTAFPNVEILKLDGVVGEEVTQGPRDAIQTESLSHFCTLLQLWTRLVDVDLDVHFKFNFYALESLLTGLGPGFWRDGDLKRFALWIKGPQALFPCNRARLPPLPLQDTFLAMKGMERVTFGNFIMPASVAMKLVRFILENDLPIDFQHANDDEEEETICGLDV